MYSSSKRDVRGQMLPSSAACTVATDGRQHVSNSFTCQICNASFDCRRSLACHQWAKHRITSDFRKYVGPISKSPICEVEFFSRSRLIKHLSERRLRSKHRTRTCQDALLNSNLAQVPEHILEPLEAENTRERKVARKLGHTNVLSSRPAQPTRASILKRDPVQVIATAPKRCRIAGVKP